MARGPWLAADLRAWRERAELSQAAAARVLAIPAATLKNYEQGRTHADGLPEYLTRLCRYYERFGDLD